MASIETHYNEIEFKIKQAIERLKEDRTLIGNLWQENENLKAEIRKLRSEKELLQEKYNLLSITKAVLTKEDKIEAKKKINDLVREIDNCITLLNK